MPVPSGRLVKRLAADGVEQRKHVAGAADQRSLDPTVVEVLVNTPSLVVDVLDQIGGAQAAAD